MQRIAHRVFNDRGGLSDLTRYREAAFDGVEFDLRLDPDGVLVVRHSPVIALPRRRSRTSKYGQTSLESALLRLEELDPRPQSVFLDIKCITAAEAVISHIEKTPLKFALNFICWHADEVALIRRHMPNAVIYFCLAPIFSRALGRVLPDDIYLFNAFPYLARSGRFAPRLVQRNRHNINVRLFSSLQSAGAMPSEADGVCLHQLFCSRALALYAKRAGLKVAVYGLSSTEARKARAYRDLIDVAIINEKRRRPGLRKPMDSIGAATPAPDDLMRVG